MSSIPYPLFFLLMVCMIGISSMMYAQPVNLSSGQSGILVPPNGWARIPASIKVNPSTFFEENRTSFHLASPYKMVLTRSETTALQAACYKFQVTYEDVPIYGNYYTLFHLPDNSWMANAPPIPANVNVSRGRTSEKEALSVLLSYINAKKYYWQDSIREKKLKLNTNDPLATYYPKGVLEYLSYDEGQTLKLCYTFHVYTYTSSKSGKYYVDAINGMVLKFLPAETVCSSGSFVSNFNGNHNVNTYDNGDEYELENDCNSSVYGVYNEWNDDDIYTDGNNDWTTDDQRSAATSLWAVKKAFNAYKNVFDRDGHDNNDGEIDIYQHHYFENEGNFNASFQYDPVGDDEINIGTGDVYLNEDDYNSLDILGHEFTHGVDEYSAELEYQYESGALDESFADIFGEWVEDQALGSHDWTTGGERSNGNCPIPLRYLIDPAGQNIPTGSGCSADFGQPNTYHGTFWYPINNCDPEASGTDNCGVHTNSGVQNQMSYLLSDGGSGWNNGNTCHASAGGYFWQVSGIGFTKMINIAYYAHVALLGPNSDYADARDAWVTAAVILYGECSNEAIQTGKAWYAVGLPPPDVAPYYLCDDNFGANPITVASAGSLETQANCYVNIQNTGNLVLFQGGTFVKLRPGFHATYGSLFKTELTDCEFAEY